MNLRDISKGTVAAPLKIGRWALEQGAGAVQTATGRRSSSVPKDLDDVTIARKVESVALRAHDTAKVDVNVVDGVVWLRGEARRPADIDAIEVATRAIPEVVDVQNLLHLPKTPAATRADTPRRAQATRRRPKTPARPRTEPRRVNADKTVATGEPLPKDLAKEGKGRQASPLGSTGDEEPKPDGPSEGFTISSVQGTGGGGESS